MIGAVIGFILGFAAYAVAGYVGFMPAGPEMFSAGFTVAILGAGIEWLVKTLWRLRATRV